MKSRKKPIVAAAAKQQAPRSNPFETKKSQARFQTLGRRLKGATKNVVKAREQAVEKRNKSLLVEYKQLRKSNSFVDRRFGEHDQGLTEDDKAFARLQTQRLKARRAQLGSSKKLKFALGGDDAGAGEDTALTHMGKSLADIDDLNEAPDKDDVDDEILEDMMKDYNFGGGGEEATAKGPDGNPRTRKQVMEEVIAKSKAFKAAKQKQKEEDLDAIEKLDEDYRSLLATQALAAFVKPKGFTKDNKVKADNKEDADYDVAARELAFEGKGKAADRTMTAEEQAEKERQLMEQMERERVKRMRGENDDDQPSSSRQEKGGFAGRRAKIQAKMEGASDSEDEDEEGEEDEEEDDDDGAGAHALTGDDDAGGDLTDLLKRRMTRAAGSHPLQSSLREKAAELAAKYGLGKVKNPMLGEEDEEGEDEGESGEGEMEDGEEGEGEGEEEEEEEDDEQEEQKEEPEDDDDAYEAELSALKELPASRQPRAPGGVAKSEAFAAGAAAAAGVAELPGPADLPFTIPVPETYEAFAKLVAGRPADQLVLVVQRIRAFNATALASDSKRKLQVMYGILVQHFAVLSGETPIPTAHLDALVPLLLLATAEVPFYAATVARARLARMHARLAAAMTGTPVASLPATDKQQASKAKARPLQQQQQQQQASAWPGPRALLQLKLFSTLFPASDRRHPVLSPALLFIGRVLAQCTATDIGEAVRGLVLAGLALHLAAPAKRHCPEAVTFITHLLLAFCSSSAPGCAPAAESEAGQRVIPGLLAPAASGKALTTVCPAQLELLQAITLPAGPDQAGSSTPAIVTDDSFKLGLLGVALHAAARAADIELQCRDSFPEATLQLRRAVASLGSQLKLPPQLEQLRSATFDKLISAASQVVAQRLPLARAALQSRTAPSREFNPRFEEDFSKGRDYDPDRERAEARKLKKEVAKERRGAMRELRKDAVFMADVRDRERAVVDAERMDSQRKFYSELMTQAADIKSGGQGGMNLFKKKRKK